MSCCGVNDLVPAMGGFGNLAKRVKNIKNGCRSGGTCRSGQAFGRLNNQFFRAFTSSKLFASQLTLKIEPGVIKPSGMAIGNLVAEVSSSSISFQPGPWGKANLQRNSAPFSLIASIST